MYVVYVIERLQDGTTESVQLFTSIPLAMKRINSIANGFLGSCCSFRLFKLGEEIAITSEKVVEPQPSKETVAFSVVEEVAQEQSGK